MKRTSVTAGEFHLDRLADVEWSLREAKAPHRAFLSDSFVDHLIGDEGDPAKTVRQIAQVAALPYAHGVVTTPDTHHGYGSPIGTVFASPATLSLAVVGVDISCGMSVVVTDLKRSDLGSREARRSLLGMIGEQVPMGKGATRDNGDVVSDYKALVERGIGGLRENIVRGLKLRRDAYEFEQDFSGVEGLWDAIPQSAMQRGLDTLGSLGGGNHFLEVQSLDVMDPATAAAWGLSQDQVVLMIHSGSRKFGFDIANLYEGASRDQFAVRNRAEEQMRQLLRACQIERCKTERRQVPLDQFASDLDLERGRLMITYTVPETGERLSWGQEIEAATDAPFFDPHFVEQNVDLPYVLNPLEGVEVPGLSKQARELGRLYWLGVQAAQNFAVLSRTIMLYRASEVLAREFGRDRVNARLLYDISHNNVQIENVGGRPMYVHRKGATRAFPAGHPSLKGTQWAGTGHPVTVPGSMGSFSYIMRAVPSAEKSLYSVNHGAGRQLSRMKAKAQLDRSTQEAILDQMDTVVLGASLDEMPDAYKPIDEVVRICREGGLCAEVVRCRPAGTVKGDDDSDD